jgi:hypothetical protein
MRDLVIAAVERVKAAAASLTDALAEVGARAPGLAQVTVAAGGVAVTVTPKPPAAPLPCATCGRP